MFGVSCFLSPPPSPPHAPQGIAVSNGTENKLLINPGCKELQRTARGAYMERFCRLMGCMALVEGPHAPA